MPQAKRGKANAGDHEGALYMIRCPKDRTQNEDTGDADGVGICDSHVLLGTVDFDILCYQVLFDKIKARRSDM